MQTLDKTPKNADESLAKWEREILPSTEHGDGFLIGLPAKPALPKVALVPGASPYWNERRYSVVKLAVASTGTKPFRWIVTGEHPLP